MHKMETNYTGIAERFVTQIAGGTVVTDPFLQELTARGIEQHLTRRYVMIAAHMTVVRFVSQPPSLSKLQHKLLTTTGHTFGTTKVAMLELVENDWYMRSENLVTKGLYNLPLQPTSTTYLYNLNDTR